MSRRVAYPLATLSLVAAATGYAAGATFSGAVLCLVAIALVLGCEREREGGR